MNDNAKCLESINQQIIDMFPELIKVAELKCSGCHRAYDQCDNCVISRARTLQEVKDGSSFEEEQEND